MDIVWLFFLLIAIVAILVMALPVLKIHEIGNGKIHRVLGQKTKKDYPWFDTQYFGMQLDPAFSSKCVPERSVRALEEYNYSTIHPLPLTSTNARALGTIVQHVRATAPDLAFLSDDEVVCLIATPRDNLDHDVHLYIEDHTPTISRVVFDNDMSKEMFESLPTDEREAYLATHTVIEPMTDAYLVDRIKTIQDETAELPVNCGPFSYSAAFEQNPSGFLSQDLESLVEQVKRLALLENDTQMLKWISIGIAAALIFIGGALAYVIITR
jgi:hypothetical protein